MQLNAIYIAFQNYKIWLLNQGWSLESPTQAVQILFLHHFVFSRTSSKRNLFQLSEGSTVIQLKKQKSFKTVLTDQKKTKQHKQKKKRKKGRTNAVSSEQGSNKQEKQKQKKKNSNKINKSEAEKTVAVLSAERSWRKGVRGVGGDGGFHRCQPGHRDLGLPC